MIRLWGGEMPPPPVFNMWLGLFHRVPYFKIYGRGFTAPPPLFLAEMEESPERIEELGKRIPEREKLTPGTHVTDPGISLSCCRSPKKHTKTRRSAGKLEAWENDSRLLKF